MRQSLPAVTKSDVEAIGSDYGALFYGRGGLLKFWGQRKFSNVIEHPVTHEPISVPPDGVDYDQWNVPPALKDDVRGGPSAIFGGKAENLEWDKFRICW